VRRRRGCGRPRRRARRPGRSRLEICRLRAGRGRAAGGARRPAARPDRPDPAPARTGAGRACPVAQVAPGFGAPPIHDVTTDPADPPAFRALPLAADNLRGVDTVERWRALHAQAYGDIRPLALPVKPAEAIRRADRIARARGWTVALAAPEQGRLEATDRVSLIGFHDDIVVEARPAPNGGSTVHARSVSRIGVSDLGINARRLRGFLADMAADARPGDYPPFLAAPARNRLKTTAPASHLSG
jgi:uncharacterized protein (DUF1499 family)